MAASLKNVLRNRWTWRLLGAVMAVLVIVFAAPLVGIAGRMPFQSWFVRLLMCLAIGVWLILTFWLERRRARQQQEAFSAALHERAAADQSIAEMKSGLQQALTRAKSHSGAKNIYQIPWFMMIGPEGAGKTVALKKSGLRLQCEDISNKKNEKGVVSGEGGTRNCDWMFTDEAILLDTAGRFMTRESDADNDAYEWFGFLDTLKKHRPRQPLNGLILAMPVDRLSANRDALSDFARQLRIRIREIYDRLGVVLPIYVIVTKMDKVPGFTDYFRDLRPDEIASIFGFAFPLDANAGSDLSTNGAEMKQELDVLAQTISTRLIKILDGQGNRHTRLRSFGFLQEFGALTVPLLSVLEQVFARTQFAGDTVPWLRAVSFTSAVQDGSVTARLLPHLTEGEELDALTPDVLPETRSYFLQDFLHKVIFREAGLAGRDRAAERRALRLRVGLLGGLVAASFAIITCWAISWQRNSFMIEALNSETARFAALMSDRPPQSLADIFAALDGLRAMPLAETASEDKYDDGVSFGLGQKGNVAPRLSGAYRRGLEQMLLPVLMEQVADDVESFESDGPSQFRAFRAYMVGAGRCPADESGRELLLAELEAGWRDRFPGAERATTREAFSRHTRALLSTNEFSVSGSQLADTAFIQRTRRNLQDLPPAARLYAEMQMQLREAYPTDLRLATLAGERYGDFFQETEVTIPGYLTAEVYREQLSRVIDETIGNAGEAGCVLRDAQSDANTDPSRGWLPMEADQQALRSALTTRYLDEFANSWLTFLSSVRREEVTDVDGLIDQIDAADSVGALSPIRLLVSNVAVATDIAPDTDEDVGDRLADKAAKRSRTVSAGQAALELARGGGGERDGAELAVKQQFTSWQDAVSGPPGSANIDRALITLVDYGRALEEDRRARSNEKSESGAAVAEAAAELEKQARRLPPQAARWFRSYAERGAGFSAAGGRAALASSLSGDVLDDCQAQIAGRFPITRQSRRDVGLQDFSAYFGPGGTIDRFFEERLDPYVDVSGRRWQLTEDGERLGLSGGVVGMFQTAKDVQRAFFQQNDLRVEFSIAPVDLDGLEAVELVIGGQTFVFNGLGSDRQRISWPLENGDGSTQLFLYLPDGLSETKRWPGDWGIFRMVNDAEKISGTDLSARYQLSLGQAKFRFDVFATSTRNPFADNAVRRIACRGLAP